MKKSAKLKRKTRRLLIKNLIVLVVLIAVSAIGVRSWIMSVEDNMKIEASGLNLACSVPDGLEVAVVQCDQNIITSGDNATVWHATEFTLSAEDYPFLANVSLSEITGDGITFIRPPLTQISTVAKVNDTVPSDQANIWSASNISVEANKQYLSFDLYFRTPKSGRKVVLDSNTYFGTTNGSTDFGSRQSGISANSVIGAARMSIVDYNGSSPARKLLWIPAPFIYYDGIDMFTGIDDETNTRGLVYYDTDNHAIPIHNDGTYNHGYYYYSGTYPSNQNEHKKIELNDDPTLGVTANDSMDYKLHKDVDVISFSGASGHTMVFNGKTYYVEHVRLNMWVEGEDPESRAAQVGGKFDSQLVFKLAANNQ